MMDLEQLERFGIDKEFIQRFKQENIKALFSHQELAIKKGLLKHKNLVLSCPTASGKTLIATLAIIKSISKKPIKIVYIVPLVALANEKYNYYKDFFRGHLKVAISVGDLDSQDPWLKDYDLIIVTQEKLDSLIRHGADWINSISLIIADEIHLINDPSRGPTLEILLSLLRKMTKKAQIIALSATISNALELSSWLKAKLVESEFRPVKLYEGVCFAERIHFLRKKDYLLESEGLEGLIQDTQKRKKQILIFVSTRKSAETLAERLSRFNLIQEKEKHFLENISKELLNALEIPTSQCRRLASVFKKGVAFHHAGLLAKQKRLIEDNFRQGLIKVIVATPTLAMGVNLPAFRVVLRDVKRYYPGRGSVYIPILEYKQFAGRAGRPQYDEFGESIIMAKSEEESKELFKHFIKAKPENIESKLAQESALRMHTLSLIACRFCQSLKSLLEFFALTFFGFQYRDIYLLQEKLEDILFDLQMWGFILETDEKLYATGLGERISLLYLDPQTAHQFILCLKEAKLKGLKDLTILQAICLSQEMQPLLNVKPKDIVYLNEEIVKINKEFLMPVPKIWDDNYDIFLRSLKTALALKYWMEEKTEEQIFEEFSLTPGELYAKLEIADWLIYCVMEISSLLGFKDSIGILKNLRIRLLYGVNEELLELVSLKEIGRVRARRLYDKGIKNISILRKIPQEELALILGPRVAQIVKRQI
ncbi:MAG: DEAD/DEAH box helicase [Candidatus Omnitrophica bacterium]|nr:DEAD/DEAH box helicase [Candidatus Omnitrophota bacterium]